MQMLFLDLLNTGSRHYSTTGNDSLFDSNWRVEWANRNGLPVDLLQSEATALALAELRSQLGRLLEKLMGGESLTVSDEESINQRLRQNQLVLGLSMQDGKYVLQAHPTKQDQSWLLAEITASFVELLAKRDAGRIKRCANPDCQWLFYDESHAKTRLWCDDSCGNLMKVRRFRKRQGN